MGRMGLKGLAILAVVATCAGAGSTHAHEFKNHHLASAWQKFLRHNKRHIAAENDTGQGQGQTSPSKPDTGGRAGAPPPAPKPASPPTPHR